MFIEDYFLIATFYDGRRPETSTTFNGSDLPDIVDLRGAFTFGRISKQGRVAASIFIGCSGIEVYNEPRTSHTVLGNIKLSLQEAVEEMIKISRCE